MNRKNRRSGKFYSKNEKEIMSRYGLKATPMSGAGWIAKEDGYNDYVLAQLKSTDANSYKLLLDDIDKLEYHAIVENKIPLFIIEFLQRDEVYFVLKPNDLVKLSKYLELGEYKETKILNELNEKKEKELNNNKRKKIESSNKARKRFYKELEEERKKKSEKFRRR